MIIIYYVYYIILFYHILFYIILFNTNNYRLYIHLIAVQMLNSFASDLDSILSDLSTSPTPAETLLVDVQAAPLSATESPADRPQPLGYESALQSPTASVTSGSVSAADVVDGAEQSNNCSAVPEISLLERLIRSHPVWYLPTIQRTAAAQLLQNEDQGVSCEPRDE